MKKIHGRYSGSLTIEECNTLEAIIALDKEQGVIPSLRDSITALTNSEIEQVIKDKKSKTQCTRGVLRDEQTLGVAFMYTSKKCILGDSVGLGKTVEVAGVLNLLSKTLGRPVKVLWLTEKTLMTETRKKVIQFTGQYIEKLYGDKGSIAKFLNEHPIKGGISHGVVGAHSLLTQSDFIAWLEKAKQEGGNPFDVLVIDESSILGNLRNLASISFTKWAKDFNYVYELNATPFEGHLKVFHAQLKALDPLGMPSKTEILTKYMIKDYTGVFVKSTDKYRNSDDFRYLIGYRYFARTRAEKGGKFENNQGRLILSDLSDVQKKWLRLSSMPGMVFDCPTYFDSAITFDEVNVPKLASLREVLDTECKDAKKVLIFSWYKEAQAALRDWLESKGESVQCLNGDTRSKEADQIIAGFIAGDYKILITNVQKGLDFGDCDYVIFYTYSANPGKMVQFEGRVTRSFDIRGKHVYLLCSRGFEYNRLKKTISARAKGSTAFAKTDYSCVLDILVNEGGEV